MACLVCNHGMNGDDGSGEERDVGTLRVQITEVGDLEPDLQLPDGGIDAGMCGDCWRWIRGIAADPEALRAADASAPVVLENDAESDD